nr:immunoglobulin heavy chain junction region [Macaca mulatta]MOW76887.1 immunoglobulin heavy chain junction region [Macaca mulatta]MOW76960.1 immunoglobulin heavy chain junction region [Macaca mulatta]MOW77096.1 immunoglobulin heavy chain junction region [Macaca mulatta]MOW79324.1 immunoglobulin heavy chain junction region [Macaca mulatta]
CARLGYCTGNGCSGIDYW